MSVEQVLEHLGKFGARDRVRELDDSTATVQLAAAGLGVEPGMIAKTLALRAKGSGQVIVIVVMGLARLDNAKFKACFGGKAQFLAGDECLEAVGHPPGGVSPFGLKPGVDVYLDESLKAYSEVYPAAGSPNSCLRIGVDELEAWTGGRWVDVCS